MKMAFPCLGKKIETQEFLMKDFRLAALSVMWNFCTICILVHCTLCTAELELVEAEGVIRLTGGRPPGRQLATG
jgi:hypothetical protein